MVILVEDIIKMRMELEDLQLARDKDPYNIQGTDAIVELLKRILELDYERRRPSQSIEDKR